MSLAQTCNKYPYQPELCVQQGNANCWFNYYENSCVLTNTNSEGCSSYLNRIACISQLFSGQTYAKCYFSDRCNEITLAQQASLGCENYLSKYACLSLLKSNCEWKDDHCQNGPFIGSLNRCQDVQGSVSPSVCLHISNEACISGGYEFDFNCQEVTDFSKISCSSIGLNLKGCVQVSKAGQNCIYIDGYCQQLLEYQDIQCDSFINRSLCISIMNPERKCQWTDNACHNLTDFGKQCIEYRDVNPTICSQISSTKCYYKDGNCVSLDNVATCDSLGINKLACDSFTTPCVFYDQKCQTINVLDNYKCSNQLNKAGCLSLQTRYQYCQWNTKCEEVFITQDTPCNLIDVNGNTCRAIVKESCKYNQISQKCEKPDNLDGCTTPFINLKGCVSVVLLRNSCRWFDEKCQLIKVDKYNTKCSDLKYSNGISCSQVYYENDVNELNCYYDSQSQGCASFLTGDQSLKCTQLGLNELGCTNIRMTDNICRWSRGKCVQVLSKSEMQAFPCLSVSSVNAQTCALIVYNKEPCKFNQVSQSCISSVDYNNDTCNTPGLNSFGCSSLVTQKCYYDTQKWKCRQLESTNEATILNSIICTDNFPTKLVCASITNLTQFCGWSVQQSVCQSIQLTPWNFCLDYKLVNPNVCSAIIVSTPNANGNQGYCGYDTTTLSCNIFVGTCSTNCCEEEKGINTHVCSRNSATTSYCYFDKPKLKCSQVILEDYTDTYAKAYISNNKLSCEQVNYAMCNLVEWSYEQYCFQQSTTDRCHSVIFNDIDDYTPFTITTSKVSRITCQAVPKASVYFIYDTSLGNCQFLQEDQSYACETDYVNINVCTRLTGDDYCLWDPSEMKCTQISDIESQGCSQFLNQNGCFNIQDKSCKFELNFNRCSEVLVTDLTDIMGCDYLGLSQNRRISQMSCSLIFMEGQACQYDSANHQCVKSSNTRASCYQFGSNMYDCYENTSSLCQWNISTQKCHTVDVSDLSTLTCTSNVNKIICLQLSTMACTWNQSKLKCENELYQATKTCQDLIDTGNQYNALACTQITGNGSYCHWEQNSCKITKSKQISCSAIPLNMYSCLIMTKTAKCFFENGLCKTFTGSTNISCEYPNIGVEVCISITGKACKYDIAAYSCQEIIITNTTKCSSLSNPNFYNSHTCISISPDVPNNVDQSYNVCGSTYCGYEKYCIWNSSTYACEIQKLNSESISYYFDNNGGLHYVCKNKYYSFNGCSSNYSKALCLELVTNSCFFELSLGGCKAISGREDQPQSCDALNYYSCPLVSTIGLSCKSQAVSNDGCINPKKIQFSCNSLDPTGQACSSYSNVSVSRNVCSNLSGYCYWSSQKCKSISSGSGYCELAGLSIDACADLGICNSGIPCTSSVSGSTYTTCDEIDQNLSGIEQQVACAQLVMDDGDPDYSQSCGYQNNSCIRLDKLKSCTTLASYIQGPDACLKYSLQLQQSCMFQDNQCILVITSQYSCSNLNKYACLKWTTEVYCLWINEECVEEVQSNLSSYTDCTIANNDACFYINAPCWIVSQLCVTSSALTICQTVQTNKGNLKACSFIGFTYDSCYYDSDNSQCAKLQSNGQTCDTPGLNIASCVKLTIGQCYFDGTQCKTLTDYNTHCDVANQFACLLLTLEPCYWNSLEQRCKTVIPVIPQYCILYSVVPSNYFNTLTCSRINNNNQFCALKPGKTVCYAITTATCDMTGINYQACTQKTTDYCYFENDKCLTVDSFVQDCNAKFNSKSCLKLTNQVCYFNVTCQLYDFSILTVANVALYTTTYIYSDRVCSQNTLTDIYLYYDNLTQKCIQVSSLTAPFLNCNSIRINKNSCLMKTNKYCAFVDGKCTTVKQSALSTQNCSDQEFNWLTCIDLKYSGCYFQNYQCLSINPASTCNQLSNVQTNIYSCSSRTDVACSHDLITRFCISQTSTTLLCTETGLNRIGCLNNTSNKRCIFDDSRLACLEGILDTYVCSDIINDKNCALVSVPEQYCYFHNTCQTQTTLQLNTCVGIYKENGLSCTKAIDVPCVYDSLTFKCIIALGNEDCSQITSLNLLGCKSNKGFSKCMWNETTESCSTIENAQLATLPCTSNINYQSCINITLAGQYCQFTTNCIAKSYTDPNNQCAQLTNVNNRLFCENVNDAPCAFDALNKNCYVVTSMQNICSRGLNRQACLQYITGGCLFGTFCYATTDIVMCYQAQTQTQCIGIDAQCQFDGTTCSDYDSTTVPCLQTPPIVSPTVCYNAIAISPFVCIYDAATSSCQTIQPSKCEEIFDAPSCARYQSQPCLWQNNKCIFYQVVKDSDECTTVNIVGTLRTCVDVNKYGQYCYYNESLKKCVTVTSIDQCETTINFNACIAQQKFQCQWEIQIKPTVTSLGTVSYHEGNCKNLVSNQQECTTNLSYLSCLNIIKQNQFCYFLNSQCNSLPKQNINLNQYKLVNSNVCTLVQNVPAVYNLQLNICIEEQSIICANPGINRVGCINVQNYKCKWISDTNQCQEQLVVKTENCLDSNVSILICQTCTGIESVYFNNGQCIPVTSETKCTDQGVNKSGCINIKKYPCIWIESKCQDFMPSSDCDNVPQNVNLQVCRYVTSGVGCKYGEGKCIRSDSLMDNCSTIGLNLQGCVQIQNCRFSQVNGCYESLEQLKCSDIGYANATVCQRAQDQCKYDPITYQCKRPAFTDTCSTVGLSPLGCLQSINECTYQSYCQCGIIEKKFPQCKSLKGTQECNKDYCYFEDQIVESQGQKLLAGFCRYRTCSDYENCIGYIDGYLCFKNFEGKCIQAKSCSDLEENNCGSLILKNSLQCIFEANQCIPLSCSVYTNNYCPTQCYLDGEICTKKPCSQLQLQECQYRKQDCFWNSDQCLESKHCSEYESDMCIAVQKEGRICGWLTNQKICTDTPCRYFGEYKDICNGMQVSNEVCVMLDDQSCVHCEEISDKCVCLSKAPYCDLDRQTQKCFSTPCENYTECPSTCRIVNSQCQALCQRLYNDQFCAMAYKCEWNYLLNWCQDKQEEIEDHVIILPQYNYGLILYILMLLILLI